MFFLEGNNSGFIIRRTINTIGRLSGDIVIKDSSISRKHAEIEVRDGVAFLRDCNSKYFTKHNGKHLLGNVEIKLQEGDRITFGEVKFKFHVGENLVVCSTAAKESEKTMAKIVNQLGGELLKNWDNTCTHLTTSEILITLKVLHAIMDNKKIVIPQFWEVYLKNILSGQLPPDASEYYPPLGENIINSSYVKYNPDRNTVFKGKTFLLLNKKKQSKIEAVIRKAGGDCLILDGTSNNNQLLKLMDKCIVMDPEDDTLEQKFHGVLEIYKRKGKRIIPVQEVVLAILQCSCQENCNPSFNRAKTVFVKETQKQGVSRPIVPETQSQQFDNESDIKPNIVPASLDPEICRPTLRNEEESPVARTPKKTQLVLEESQMPAKRIKLDPEILPRNEEESSVAKPSSETQLVLEETQLPAKRIKMDNEIPLTDEEDASSKKNAELIFKRITRDSSPTPAKRLKKGVCINPFAVIASSSKENPYNSLKKEDDVLDLTNNQFGQTNLPKSVDVKTESIEKIDVKIVKSSPSNVSKNQVISNTTVPSVNSRTVPSSRTKRGKKTIPFVGDTKINYSNIKHDVSVGKWVNSNVRENEESKISSQDEEERKWCEKFNNSVVIVVKDLLRKDRIDQEQENIQVSSVGSSVKNFKKFRKVPVPKSGVMIKCSRSAFGGSNLGIDYGHSDNEDNRDM